MTHRRKLFAALLAAALTTTALADPAHHPPDAAPPPDPSPVGMEGAGAMGHMHDGMMGQMHEMMVQMHGAQGGQMPGMMHGDAGTPGLEGLAGGEFEVAFMSMMIAHHQGAVAMADWVLERGDEPEVLGAARAIQAAQGPEIERMTAWLREWYGADVDAGYAATMEADMGGMMAAMAAGADPDTAFLEEMIRHHQGAIDMAQLALERATHAELRELARDIIVAQAEEVNQYRTWLDSVEQ
ncbi:MAG: DUF305 domain-containing protein [Trueperaceae bacterium]